MSSVSMNGDWSRSIVLAGAATFFVVSGLGYASGSAPEWVVMKGSIGFASVALMGWALCLVLGARDKNGEEERPVGSHVDVTLPEASPASAPARQTANDRGR